MYRLVMLAQSGVYDAAIKQYFGGIRDVIEGLEGLLKFIVVVMAKGGDPRLNFLSRMGQRGHDKGWDKVVTNLLEGHGTGAIDEETSLSNVKVILFAPKLPRNAQGRNKYCDRQWQRWVKGDAEVAGRFGWVCGSACRRNEFGCG